MIKKGGVHKKNNNNQEIQSFHAKYAITYNSMESQRAYITDL